MRILSTEVRVELTMRNPIDASRCPQFDTAQRHTQRSAGNLLLRTCIFVFKYPVWQFRL